MSGYCYGGRHSPDPVQQQITDMDNTLVFAKTPAGQDEIATRARKLAPRLRSLLFMVDGKTSVDALNARAGEIGDIAVYLIELEQMGLIKPLSGASGAAAPKAAAPAPAAPKAVPAAAAPGIDFKKVRQEISRIVYDTLGPDGEGISEKIEGCQTREELLAYCENCKSIVQEFVGKSRAEKVEQQVKALLGG